MGFRNYLVILSWALSLTSYAGTSTLSLPALKTFTLEELVPPRPDLYPERLNVQWISGKEYIYTEPGIGLRKYNAETDTTSIFLANHELINLGGLSIGDFSKDGKYMLLSEAKKRIYRYSSVAEYSIYDTENQTIARIGGGPIHYVEWGSDTSLAFVRDNNVYYMPDVTAPDLVKALTTEGVPGEVYFGITDWIYEEEVFNSEGAIWFSPGGEYLAVASFNDTEVPSASYPYYGDPTDLNSQYPHIVSFKYPKAGRMNPVAALHVHKLNKPNSEPWPVPIPVNLVGTDNILGRVNWASKNILAVLWLNRRQNVSVLMNCNMDLEQCVIVKEHREPNGWIDIAEPFFDESGTKMVEIFPMYYGDRRYMHAALFDYKTLKTVDLSVGNSTVTKVLGWNLKLDTVYFIVAPSGIPWQRQLWAHSGGAARCVSCKDPACHHVVGEFAPGADYAILTCSAMNDPPRNYLFSSKDESFKLLHDNGRLRRKLSQYKLPMSLFNTLTINGERANVQLLLPPDMEPNKKYPMVVRVYAGPGSSRVRDNFDLDYSTYLAANRSFIVGSIDVRGSDVLGVEAMHAVNNALGTYEVADTLAVIRRLVSLHSFIDGARVGVWGWSYGGFASTMMLVQDQEKTLACGAAVAPVTSWLYYDTIYTERYMDTPTHNPDGYLRSDLMLRAAGLRGRRFLLAHGSGDDNVHYQNSVMLAKQLQHLDIEFEQMTYTDESHSLLGVSRHLYHTLDRFWSECFA
ncbi:venom dipeptidyl peptidase 4 [Plutella xylostella]|uniref:venom dipeptidyl peptidase 4 n=1 Tax=Plutella xylostella TaxID=51655 RepID=UPI002032469D|nr:venom dipeptidyl peptidase 4 [Plutella xylostella]